VNLPDRMMSSSNPSGMRATPGHGIGAPQGISKALRGPLVLPWILVFIHGCSSPPPPREINDYSLLWTHQSTKSGFGCSLAVVADMDDDGVQDVVVGDVAGEADPDGSICILSGRTGKEILRYPGGPEDRGFGVALAVVPSGADRRLVAVGSPFYDQPGLKNCGRLALIDMSGPREVWSLAGDSPGSCLGLSVASTSDFDGDGVDEIVAGAPLTTRGTSWQSGEAFVVSSKDGTIINRLDGGHREKGRFGNRLLELGDVDGDGIREFAISSAFAFMRGTVWVFSGRTMAEMRKWEGQEEAEQFGFSAVECPDMDGDGLRDVAIASPLAGNGSGVVRVLSTRSGHTLRELRGPPRNAWFGWSLCGGIDWDGDGKEDLVVGAPNLEHTVDETRGSLFIYSLENGACLARIDAPTGVGWFGYSVVSCGSGTEARLAVGAPGEITRMPRRGAAVFLVGPSLGDVRR